MGISFGEVVIVLLVVFAFVKPKDAGDLAKKFAEFLASVKREGGAFIKEFQEPVDNVAGPVKEVQGEINNAVQEIVDSVKGGKE